MNSTLIAIDQPDVRAWLNEAVRAIWPLAAIVHVCSVAEGAAKLKQQPYALVLLDMALLHAARALRPEAVPVVVAGQGGGDHWLVALQAGAQGYLLTTDPRERLIAALQCLAHGEPALSPSVSRQIIGYFADGAQTSHPHQANLSVRETDILRRLAKGFTLPEIAEQLNLSRHTVADYVKQIYRKLHVSSRAEATLEAARRGLVR